MCLLIYYPRRRRIVLLYTVVTHLHYVALDRQLQYVRNGSLFSRKIIFVVLLDVRKEPENKAKMSIFRKCHDLYIHQCVMVCMLIAILIFLVEDICSYTLIPQKDTCDPLWVNSFACKKISDRA